ncbi:AAA family ATPase [Halomonas sp. M4R1S46]|uniref:AAA family ATPase n=1 Tax=Halomonas sp. M4R1S46 TaxID=2982692 RepID=UPI0021E4DC86|nr:AAA family ATPase [Halomonas sp. M4R1S46]UYG06393.1 AAA family ATPase [Halomonas sp. M4R1S46]
MYTRLEILLAGRAREELEALEALLRSHGDIHVRSRLMVNGNVDPLESCPGGREATPDALILLVGEQWEAELLALCERPATERLPLLVVGPRDNVELIRLAMRAGARDYFSPPVDDGEITSFLRQLSRDRSERGPSESARLTAVINAKGGSGASLVAANLAHRLAVNGGKTLLLDMDVQFGSMPMYFNLSPEHGLIKALEVVESLDGLALEAYIQRHVSGLELLASSPDDRIGLGEVPEARVEQLLQVLCQGHDEVVVDLPRWIGGTTASVLERADHVLLVMQQSVAHLHDAQRLRDILVHELRVPASRLHLVINRFDKRSDVSLDAITDVLPGVRLYTLPNDFRLASQGINVGTPLIDLAPKAALTRRLHRLADALDEPSPDAGGPVRKWSLRLWPRRGAH